MRLVGAIDEANAVYPEGEGYLHIPAEVHKGYIRVRCYYSPRLTSTLLSENGCWVYYDFSSPDLSTRGRRV